MMKYCQPLFLIFFLANIDHKMMKDDGLMTILYNCSPVVMATLAWQSTLGSPVVMLVRIAVSFLHAQTNHCVSASNTFCTI